MSCNRHSASDCSSVSSHSWSASCRGMDLPFPASKLHVTLCASLCLALSLFSCVVLHSSLPSGNKLPIMPALPMTVSSLELTPHHPLSLPATSSLWPQPPPHHFLHWEGGFTPVYQAHNVPKKALNVLSWVPGDHETRSHRNRNQVLFPSQAL